MPDNTAIRSFQVTFPDTDVAELRRRIKMTRWPDHELGLGSGGTVESTPIGSTSDFGNTR